MKYAILKVSNGTFTIAAEDLTLESAIVLYHQNCSGLWAEPEVVTGSVSIINEEGLCVQPWRESIHHEATNS